MTSSPFFPALLAAALVLGVVLYELISCQFRPRERTSLSERRQWELVRPKGHTRYILISFLGWGVPMWATQTFGPILYALLMHQPHAGMFQIFSPAAVSLFQFVLWVFGFGFVMGEANWQMHERAYRKK